MTTEEEATVVGDVEEFVCVARYTVCEVETKG